MSTFEEKLNEITPEVYENLKRALELGKWPNGDRLSEQQKAICMEAVIHFDHSKLPESERVGYIEKKGCKSDRKEGQSEQDQQAEQEQPIKFSE